MVRNTDGQAAVPALHAAAPGDQADRDQVAPLDRSGLLLNVAFWSAMAVLTVVVVGLTLPLPADGGAARGAIWMIVLHTATWAAATPFIFSLATRFRLEHGTRMTRVLLFIAIGIVLTPALSVAVSLVFHFAVSTPAGTTRSLAGVMDLARRTLVPGMMTYAAVVAAGLAREASLRAHARREHGARLATQNAQLQAQLAEARLTVLRTQLNPHFLFNTLNAVSGLLDDDPRGVRRMIARLSELLRYALREDREQLVTVSEETRLVRVYLEILEIRFQGHLATEVRVDAGVEEALVPSMVLQPLVENAMKHGVGRAGGRGRIEVRVRREGDELVLTVRDTGPGAGGGSELLPDEAGSGLGLHHTRERLEQLYGSEGRLTLQPNPAGGMDAEVVVPFYTRADLRTAALSPST